MLRQATPTITTENLHLFDPIDPQRGLDRNIAIDYYLKNDADEVKIEFLDAQGNVVRSFTGDAEAAGACRASTATAASSAAAGARRRQEGHEPLHVGHALRRRHRLPRHDHVGGAAAARPGRAARQLHRARHRQRRDQDAGLHHRHRQAAARPTVTEADLLEQFKLSTQMQEQVTEANTAVIQIADRSAIR